MSIIGIWSEKNNLKHYEMATATMTRPNTADGFGGFFSTSTVVHDLGYIPLVRAYFDPLGDGTIYPSIGQYIATTGADSSSPLFTAGSVVAPFMFFASNITTTTVTFTVYGFSGSAATFDYYYRIYLDPTL